MAALIFATAQNGIPVLPDAPSTQIVITEAIRVLHTVEASRDAILTQMQALAKTLPEYSLVREMPCIGDTLAPRLIAEIGDVRRFHSKRALIAYAGIDAPPYQSGKFCANNRHISKRGNRYPVSYTHLDVYKRQRTAGLCGRAAGACDCGPLSCTKIERPSPLEKTSCKVRLFVQNRSRKYRPKVTGTTLFQNVSHPDF